MTIITKPYIKVTLMKSFSGCSISLRKTFLSLGLTKRTTSHVLPNNPCIVGQINKVIQFLQVEPVDSKPISK
jgi:ribosomal protein L30